MNIFSRQLPVIYFLFISFCLLVSCRKPTEELPLLFHFYVEKDEPQPPFPMLTFDTVFTSIGSITKAFTVHNPSNNDITTTIFLAGGKKSNYSINVNGMVGTYQNESYFKDVTIPKRDSIFIFVKVNINPGNVNEPFFITDSIVFLTGQHKQDVKLLAYGQDARYIYADPKIGYKVVAGLPEHDYPIQHEHWTKEKPYVVYGWAVIDSACSLTIEPGTKIYFHAKSGLWAYRYSKLEVKGTLDEPVLLRGDRLEKWFDTDCTQWSGIWINEGTEVNINNAIITNAVTGVQVNPLITDGSITITPNSCTKIENTIIKNTSDCGVWAMFLNVEMTNCVITNNGSCSVLLEGGNHTLKHLTIGNYNQLERKNPACFVSNKLSAFQNDTFWETKADFINCIITGKNENEVAFYQDKKTDFKVEFQNCLVKAKKDSAYFNTACLHFDDPKFTDKDKLDFKLLPASPAIGKGKPNIGVDFDILGNPRGAQPDMGAYQTP